MRRREFITLLSGVAVGWPLAALAQQAAVPVIGFLDERSPDAMGVRLREFHEGLKETGFVDGDNVSILYRFAEDKTDRLAGLAADLVQRNVTVIATAGSPAAFAAARQLHDCNARSDERLVRRARRTPRTGGGP
jgi:putative tryptophan/tyrosine transport system substrate-binding protein